MPERIISRARPLPIPEAQPKGHILMRVDPQAIGRFTRFDLDKHGYRVTSVHHLTPDVIARQAPDTILFFHHTDEPLPLEALETLPQGIPVIVATVGTKQPDRKLVELAKARGYAILTSRLGPNLHVVLRTLSRLRTPLN